MTGVDAQVLTPRAADTVAAVTGPAERTGAQLAMCPNKNTTPSKKSRRLGTTRT